MSWFRQKSNNQAPDYTGLQLQTAVGTLPIPIVWGQSKIAANVVWYTNFQTHGSSGHSGKGGIFGGGETSNGYTYSADLIMGLCEGPIAGLGTIWRDQSTYTLAGLGLTLFDGTTPQPVWSYLNTAWPAQALAYQGTAYVCAASYALGSAANIGNHNFEVVGILAGTGANGIDADPAQVISDFLTNPQYGAGFAPGNIDATTLFGSGADASLQTYCRATGIAFSPALVSQEQGSSVLSRWLQLLNCGAVWTGGQLKFIPYGDMPLPSGNLSRNVQSTVPNPTKASSGVTPPPTIVVCPAADFISDEGVTYAFTGAPLSYIGASAPTSSGKYGLSPAGAYLFAKADESAVVSISFTCLVSVSYFPNTTPVYNLTDLDFVDDKSNKDPVEVSRLDSFSLPSIQRLECLSRSNQYGATTVEARDQSQIELYGPRAGSTIQAREICDEVVIGPIVAQTILQRGLYVRAHFTFKLSWEYGLLDPMDIVTITDPNLGVFNYPVRITVIEEDDKGLLTITAEELQAGVSSPALYVSNGPSGYQANHAVAADAVNPPFIFEPPTVMTSGTAQIWVGASGGSGGAADPDWGGAFVWISVDNVTYSNIATITAPIRQGFLTANIASATGWDLANTLSVNLAESAGVLAGTSQASAQQGSTLSLIEGELLAYQSATLVSGNSYNLTGLARGLYGTAAASHPSGAPFTRLDSAIASYTLPTNFIGATLYFKFQSFNVFGSGVQGLDSCSVYTYTSTGGGVPDPIGQQLLSGFPLDLGSTSVTASVSDDFGSTVGGVLSIIDLGTAP